MSPPAVLRVLMVGSGQRAQRLARELARLPSISIVGLTSPGAPQKLNAWPNLPRFGGLAEALAAVQPQAAIVASANASHAGVASELLRQGIPTLIEKPLTATEAEAEALVALAESTRTPLMPAHNVLFATGLEHVLENRPKGLGLAWERSSQSGDAPRSWDRVELFEVLFHPIALLMHSVAGDAVVTNASFAGDVRPTRLMAAFRSEAWEANLLLTFDAAAEQLEVLAVDDPAGRAWRRAGRQILLRERGRDWEAESRGGELERMLRHFQEVALGRAVPMVTPPEALSVMRATRRVLEALESAGAPLC